MKKVFSILVMIMIITLLPVMAYATEVEDTGTSLSDLINSSENDDSNSFIDDLGGSARLDTNNQDVQKAASGMKRIVGFVIQILSYVLTFGLVLRVVLDLIYIGVPFSRSLLGGGRMGVAQNAGMQQPGMGGMGGFGGGLGGFGGGFGGGGFGGGFNRFGGMGGMGMGGMQQPGMMGQQQPGMMNKIHWVSNAAVNAVAAETAIGPDGKTASPLKLYAKDMIIVLIITPIMLVLAVSGALVDFGFLIGDILTKAIDSVGGNL